MSVEALRHPWPSIDRQRQAAVFGIWLFLATEVLFFGGLFAGYAVYRMLYSSAFIAGAKETEIVYGGANTAVLLTSSFAMAVGVKSARAGMARAARFSFLVTAFLGLAFLIIKGFEYSADISRHLVPGLGFAIALGGAEIFWTFYWAMTLVHAIHLVIGIAIVIRLYVVGRRDAAWLKDSPAGEVTGLYWHFVDVMWVFLFPLLYLAGRT